MYVSGCVPFSGIRPKLSNASFNVLPRASSQALKETHAWVGSRICPHSRLIFSPGCALPRNLLLMHRSIHLDPAYGSKCFGSRGEWTQSVLGMPGRGRGGGMSPHCLLLDLRWLHPFSCSFCFPVLPMKTAEERES